MRSRRATAGKLRTPHVVFIRPELWQYFGSNTSINEALETLVRLGVAARRSKSVSSS